MSNAPGVFNADVSTNHCQFLDRQSTSVGTVADYDALVPDGKRRQVSGRIRSEDQVLSERKRDRLFGNATDAHRNIGTLAYTVRCHLNYTTLLDYQPCNEDESLNDDLRALMARDSRKENCDVGGRHSWNKMRRLAEVLKLLGGDCGLLQLRSGHLQGLESNQIRTPRQKRKDAKQWVNGVKLGRGRRAMAYGLTERDNRGRLRERVVPASQLMLLASFEGRFDQVRGISPLAGSLNEWKDAYGLKTLMQARAKVDQIFAAAFTRKAYAEGFENDFPTGDTTDAADAGEPAINSAIKTSYNIGQDVTAFDLDDGEGIELLQSNSPSTQTQDFLQLSILMAMKCLDIPYDLFDSRSGTFSSNKSSWIHYERAAECNSDGQQELHRQYTIWRKRRWLLPKTAGGTGELILPSSMSIDDLKWKWVRRGVPWWKPIEELTADLWACAAGLKDFQQVCDEHGFGLWHDNIKSMKRQFKQAKAQGITLKFQPGKMPLIMEFDDAPTQTMEDADV